MDQIKIKASARTEQGTGAVRRLRRAGMVPASVMSMNKGGTKLIKFDAHEFMMAMRGRTGKQLLVTLDVDGTEVPALLREMQNDVLAGTPIHVDFSEVSLTQKVRVTVPLYLVGYVATAVYGSYDCPQVWTLRRYRDYKLDSTWYGRLFIRLYYATSPTLVKWFGHTSWFKKMWKGKLDRMVERLRDEGYEDTPYNDKY